MRPETYHERPRLQYGYPVTGQGISDAFRSAEWCVAAVDEAFTGRGPYDAAMADYQRIRDQHVLPIYEFTTQLATLEPPPPQLEQLFAAMEGRADAMDEFVSVVAGTVPPAAFFAPENIDRIMARAGMTARAGRPSR